MKRFMFKFTGIVVIVLISIVLLSNPTNSNESSQDGPIKVSEFLTSYDQACSSLMKTLGKAWARSDGEGVFVIGDEMFWALILNPNIFYAELGNGNIGHHKFTERLKVCVFWNNKDSTTAHLERLQIVAIERLEDQTRFIEDKYMHFHEEFIEILKKIKVSGVR